MRKLTTRDAAVAGSGVPDELIRSSIHRKYRLTSVLAEDFLGVLYKSAKRSGGQPLAVKVLRSDFFIADELIGKVEHSRIARVHDTVIDKNGLQAIVIKAPTGKRLSDLTSQNHETTEGEAVSAVLQLLSAVHAVHWCDEVVGNIHSDSIYLSRDKHDNLELELVNIGIGCFDDAVEKPYYQAPEQISGSGTDHRADIWAAGIILYEMLFGKRPFEGNTRYEIGGEILLKEPSYQSTWSNIPDDLIEVIKHALMKDPRRRYDNVSNMIADLLPFQAEFKEPMSDTASAAIRDSYPPPGIGKKPGKGKSIASKPIRTLTKGLKSIAPGPRIGGGSKRSSPEKAPDAKKPEEPRKFATPLPAVKSKLNKKTMMGMPPISAPAPSPAPPSAPPPEREAAPLSDAPPLEDPSRTISLDPSGSHDIPDTPRAAAGPSPMERLAPLASILTTSLQYVVRPLIRNRKAGAAVVGILLAAIAAALFAAFKQSPRDPAAPADAVAPTTSPESAPPPSATKKKPTTSPEPTTAPEEPTPPTTITLAINGLPKRTAIIIGKKKHTSPITLPYSKDPVDVIIKKWGYKTVVRSITPTQDISLDITMEKKDKIGKRPPHRKTKKDAKGSKTSSSDLADNPFGD